VYPCLKHWGQGFGRATDIGVPMLSSALLSCFFSSRLYNDYHLLVPNEINRYSAGTKSKDLKLNSGDSLPIYVQCHTPSKAQSTNWLSRSRWSASSGE
jgi:hypothetical protein